MTKYYYQTKRMTVFRRWTHKSYAVFNSFGKIIKIGALSLSSLIVAMPVQAQEKKDTSSIQKVIDFDEIEITGETAPFIYSSLSRLVIVINKEEIESSPAQSIQELLEYALNVDLRTRGGHDIQADVSLRGGSFDQTLILLNGINVSDPQTGHFALNLPIDFESIDRIEILYGPAARVFGANAFNGAINIITGSSEKSTVKVYGSYGEHNLYHGGGSLNLTSGKLNTFFAASKKGSDGYMENTDFEALNLFHQGAFNLDKIKLGWQAGYNQKDFGAITFYSAKYDEQYEDNSTRFAALSADYGEQTKISTSVYFREHHDHFVLFRANPEWYQNFHLNRTSGVKLRASSSWKAGKTSYGTEFRNERILSTNLGMASTDSVLVSGQENIYYNKRGERTYLSAFIDHSIVKSRFNLSAGAMIQYMDETGVKLFPGMDASFKITNNLRVIGSANRSMRMPTFTDLYYTSPTNKGNVDLVPEQSTTYEAGLKYQNIRFSSSLTVFNRSGSNIIDWVWTEDSYWHTQNITELNTNGVEVSIDYQPYGGTLGVLVNRVLVSYAYLNISKASSDYETKYSMDNLKHNVSLSIDHSIYKKLNVSWQFCYRDRFGTYQDYVELTDSYVSKGYEAFVIADARISWVDKNWKVFMDVSNIFNSDYIDLGSIPQPGRWFKVGGNYRFHLW